jgi:hypothetical protein
MADIYSPDAFMQGRWNWTAGGYEANFPRKCQFTDLDAGVEFDGLHLFIECKEYDGPPGICPNDQHDDGQRTFLRSLVSDTATVFILFGVAKDNNPWCARVLKPKRIDDNFVDWRSMDAVEDRRVALKELIESAMNVNTPK